MAKNKNVKKGSSGKSVIEDKLKAEEILQSFKGGETELEEKKTELIKAKENYYRLCREFLDLWSKTRTQRGGL
jgi:hypothetical protein